MRLAARASGNKENIRRAAHMKMLASSAQTIPLWVGKDGEEPPELCGSIPADQSYIAEQVRIFFIFFLFETLAMGNVLDRRGWLG